MTNAQKAKTVAAAALLLVAVTSCANHSNGPAVMGSSSPTSSSPTTTTTSESQNASVEASALVRKYVTVVDQVRRDSAAPLSNLTTVATSTQLAAIEKLVQRERGQGVHQTGDSKVDVLKVQVVNLDNSDPSAGKVPTVQIDVCVDVSKVDVLGKNGQSIVSPNRPNTGWTRYLVANYHYAADPTSGWRVVSGQDLPEASCAPS